MSFHTVALTEGHVTLWTLVGFLSGMDPHVSLQTDPRMKQFVAFAASIRFLSEVVFHVSVMLMFCMKPSPADFTLVRFLLDHVTRVTPHVLRQTVKGA